MKANHKQNLFWLIEIAGKLNAMILSNSKNHQRNSGESESEYGRKPWMDTEMIMLSKNVRWEN